MWLKSLQHSIIFFLIWNKLLCIAFTIGISNWIVKNHAVTAHAKSYVHLTRWITQSIDVSKCFANSVLFCLYKQTKYAWIVCCLSVFESTYLCSTHSNESLQPQNTWIYWVWNERVRYYIFISWFRHSFKHGKIFIP